MDPFLQNVNNISFEEDKIVEIIIENRGRKVNTYIVNWNISTEEKKAHLKVLKKTFGCNGSVKQHNISSVEIECIHLQGTHTEKIKNYLEDNNISNIVIKE